jgi:ArsR family transcriptional regulator
MKDLSIDLLNRLADTLKLLAHPQRLKIIEILQREEEAPVHSLTEQLGLAQAATSHHLNRMRRVGLLASERHGKEVWYSIADDRALAILDCVRRKGGKR